MKKRNKIQVRPTRLAGYLVLFLADIFLYLFFDIQEHMCYYYNKRKPKSAAFR